MQFKGKSLKYLTDKCMFLLVISKLYKFYIILISYVLKRFHLFHFYKIKNFMRITAYVFCHCAILDVRILNNFNVMTEILYILCVDVFTYYLLGHKCKVMNWVQQQQVQMVLKILIHILVQPGGKSYYVKNVNYHLLHKTFF